MEVVTEVAKEVEVVTEVAKEVEVAMRLVVARPEEEETRMEAANVQPEEEKTEAFVVCCCRGRSEGCVEQVYVCPACFS